MHLHIIPTTGFLNTVQREYLNKKIIVWWIRLHINYTEAVNVDETRMSFSNIADSQQRE